MEATLENWQVGPANRRTYHHVDELVATVTVPRGEGPASPLASEPVDLDGLYDEHLAQAFVDGIAVLHDGALVYERYPGEMRPEGLHLSQSVGKSVLGLLVGILAAEGRLRVEDPVTAYVPEVADSGYAGATVGHLLDMTAATDFVEDYRDFWRYDLACGWFPPRPGEARTILDFLPGIGPAEWAHGERFTYATPNTDLLGVIAERAGGGRLAELLGRHLWGPLGAERDALLTVDPAGTAAIGGGFCATVRDYARLGQLVLDGGRGIVPDEWLAGLGAGDPAAWAERRWPTERDNDGVEGYARQWWIQDGRVAARGIHGQTIVVDRRARVVLAIFSSWPQAASPAFIGGQRRFADAAVAQLAALA